MTEEQFLSTSPDDAVESTWWHDIDVLIAKARWVILEYTKKDGIKTGQRSTGLQIWGQPAEGDPSDTFMRAGAPDTIIPNEDGTRLKVVPGKSVKGLNNKCKANRFLHSLKEAGFEGDVGGDISVLDGVAVHIIQEKMEQRARPGQKAPEKDTFYTLVTKVLEEWAGPVPGEAKATGGKKKLKRKGASSGADVKAMTTELVLTVAQEAGEDGAAVATLGQKVFNKAKTDAATKEHAKAISQLAIDDAFLGDEDAPFGYDEEEGVVVHPDFLADE